MKKIILTTLLLLPSMFSQTVKADLESMKERLPALVEAKEAGLVGELPDGLVGLVDASKADDKTKELVKDENKDRLEIYKSRADKAGQELPIFMKVIGEARIEKEKAGRFFKKADGSWQKK